MTMALIIIFVLSAVALLCNWMYKHFISHDSVEEEETNVEEAPQAKESSTDDIVYASLRELQCNIDTSGDDKHLIYFEYQSEHFSIRWDESRFVHLYDISWYSFDVKDIEQLSRVKRIINDINWQSDVTLSYTKQDDDNTFNVHVTHTLLCVDAMDFTDYLRHILRQCFIAHNQFFRALSESKSK